MDTKKSSELSDYNQSQQDDKQSSDDAHEVPYLALASSAFQTPVKCYDVAVASDGCHLLVAAMQCGLKELDWSGAELSSWKPAERTAKGRVEWVGTVEALLDGRVAVGLLHSQCVVLLRRSPASHRAWLEDQRVTELQISPWQLSLHADIVAVSQGYDKTLWWRADRSLVLASLCCSRVLSRQRREYEIQSLTVTAQVLVTASCGTVNLGDTRQGRIVDACNHDGQLLWRQELGVNDICASPSGKVLYMALYGTDRKIAVRIEDGSLIKDILPSCSSELRGPARLSVNIRGRGTVAAVLSGDWTTVTVYSPEGGR